ncbi:MAG: aldo/keto reductase, partial [Pseudomonadota bacterium]
CAELGVAMVAFSPVGRGMLTDRPHDLSEVQSMGFLKGNPRFMEPNLSANLALTAGLRDLAKDMGVSAAALSIAWLVHQGEHILPIPGTRHIEHLRQVAAGGSITLSAEDIARIEAVLPIGWAHGDRYSARQWEGPERYC